MSAIYPLREQWFGNVRGDILSGLLVALALIPEAIAFSIIAGVDPKAGLYAAFCIAVVTAIAGGRPGMTSAATGARQAEHTSELQSLMRIPYAVFCLHHLTVRRRQYRQ